MHLESFTYYAIDATLSHCSFRNDHQVSLDASFLQVVTAVTSVPWLHIKLPVKTLHGALWDVDTTGTNKHTEFKSDFMEIQTVTVCCFHKNDWKLKLKFLKICFLTLVSPQLPFYWPLWHLWTRRHTAIVSGQGHLPELCHCAPPPACQHRSGFSPVRTCNQQQHMFDKHTASVS